MAHTDEQIATALAVLEANGGNMHQTSRDTGIPLSTLRDWREGRKPYAEGRREALAPKVEEARKALADELQEVAYLLVGDIKDEERRKKTTVKDLAVAMGIAVEKMQLLRGEATSRDERTGGGGSILLQLNQQFNQR